MIVRFLRSLASTKVGHFMNGGIVKPWVIDIGSELKDGLVHGRGSEKFKDKTCHIWQGIH